MAERADRAQANPGAALTALYTCPGTLANMEADVVVTVSNNSGADKTFRLSKALAGAADANPGQYYALDTVLPARESMPYAMNLKGTDVVRCYGQDNTVVFNADVVERDRQ